MLRWLLAVLLLIPLLDVLLLVVVARHIGLPPTVALVVLTAFVGLMLVRAEGRQALGRIQRKVARGEAPTDELLDGGFLIAAGAFLLTPGLVTDGIGFLFVIPPTRYLIREALKRWVVVPIADAKSGGFVTGNVYVGGFPGGGRDEDGGSGGDTVDLGDDAYEVDLGEGSPEGGGDEERAGGSENGNP